MSSIRVVKRDGSLEPLDLEKFHKVVAFACEGLTGVSESQIEIQSQIQFKDKIKTSDVQEILIKAARELISEDTPNYQYVAARLVNYHLRKEVYGKYEPDKLFAHYKRIRDLGYYDAELGEKYSEEEWGILQNYINHDRDDLLVYAAMEQFRGKYLVKNRHTKQFYETPQMAFMLMAMWFFMNEKNDRLKWVKDFYDAVSLFDISLPSPIMAGVRSPDKQFSSCVLIECGDSLDSINATTSAIVKHVANRAGIGVGAGRMRAVNSPVRGGKAVHTGVTPFLKLFEAGVDSCSQGGLRKGSATVNLWGLHIEFENLIELKNNKGTPETRAQGLDYVWQLNRVLLERMLDPEGVITLFCPNDVPEVYDAFFSDDIDRFRELYEKAERNTRLRKKQIPALEYFQKILMERKETGRIYISFVDNVNSQGSFIPSMAPVKMTNLCVEVTLPTKPLEHVFDTNGEIALCTLAALNFGKANSPHWFEKPSRLIVRALNNLLDQQDYMVPAAELAAKARRPLGIGVTNLAYWFAKNDTSYSGTNLVLLDEYMEAFSYYLIKASVDLADERGPCSKSHETEYSLGNFPHNLRKKAVDELVPHVERMPWDKLHAQILNAGILNSTLMACMPCETSSATTNSTSAIDPIPALVTFKQSKDIIVPQIAPESRKLKNKYELKWDIPGPKGMIKIGAIIQKWIDQAISLNTTYNPTHYEGEEIPMSEMIEDLVMFYKYGGKQLYYQNTYVGGDDDSGSGECISCQV